MPKETRDKSGNQKNSTPYNVSNSSFAQRITSKLTQFIPTVWVSGWSEQSGSNDKDQVEIHPHLIQVEVEINHVDTPISQVEINHVDTPVSQVEINHVDTPVSQVEINHVDTPVSQVEINHVDTPVSQVEINHVNTPISQSAKKSSLPNHNNKASNSNNRTAYTSLAALGNETCSPIVNSYRHPRDYQQAVRSSGFGQSNKPVQNVFVASTPAFNINKQPNGNADNGSDSGESASANCSSLVSQSNKQRVGGVDLGQSTSLFPNRQIPTDEITNCTGPHFDTTLFNSRSPSLNKSVNLSPFYPGRTMYGGAATYKKHSIDSGSIKSSISPSVFNPFLRQRASLCNQSKVNPSPITLPKMSIVADNILKTINAMTPVTLLMTMPRPEEVNPSPTSLRCNGQGSGVKRKLPELQITNVVNTSIRHLKGTEKKSMLSRSVHGALSSSSSSDEDLNYEIVSNDAKQSLKENMKRAKRGKSTDEESQADTEDPVLLANAVLNYPVIDIPLLSGGMDVSFSDPVECQDFNFSSESFVLSISSNQVNTTDSSVNFMYNNTESTKPKPRISITLPPVEVSPNKSIRNILNKYIKPKLTYTWKCDICTNKHHTSDSICKICNQPRSISIKQTDSGIRKSTARNQVVWQSSSEDTKPSTAPSSFGIDSVSAATKAQSVTTAFLHALSFGVPKAQDSNTSDKETSTSVSSSLTSPSAPSASPSPANSVMIKTAASETKTSSAAPVLNFVSPAVSCVAETVTNTSVSTPTFSLGNSNDPITNLGTHPVDVKAPESVKGSLFGIGSPTTSFSQPVNNTGANKSPVNSFGEKRGQFNLTNSNSSDQPPRSDFGKPATNAEPGKPLFGGSVFEKPKENNTAFPIPQQSTPSSPLFAFGNSTFTPAPNPQPALNSAVTFGASNNNSTPNFNIPQANQQPFSMLGSTGGSASVFGATNNAQPAAAAAPIFGSCGFSQPTPAQPAAASTPFAFGVTQSANNNPSMGFSFGTQNTAPVPNNNAAFSSGTPSAPPTFDPNMKLTFNFTNGAPTTFNAQPSQGINSGRRIMKKAVRLVRRN